MTRICEDVMLAMRRIVLQRNKQESDKWEVSKKRRGPNLLCKRFSRKDPRSGMGLWGENFY